MSDLDAFSAIAALNTYVLDSIKRRRHNLPITDSEWEANFNKLVEIRNISCDPGNLVGEYAYGMANGIILAIHTMGGGPEEINYIEMPLPEKPPEPSFYPPEPTKFTPPREDESGHRPFGARCSAANVMTNTPHVSDMMDVRWTLFGNGHERDARHIIGELQNEVRKLRDRLSDVPFNVQSMLDDSFTRGYQRGSGDQKMECEQEAQSRAAKHVIELADRQTAIDVLVTQSCEYAQRCNDLRQEIAKLADRLVAVGQENKVLREYAPNYKLAQILLHVRVWLRLTAGSLIEFAPDSICRAADGELVIVGTSVISGNPQQFTADEIDAWEQTT